MTRTRVYCGIGLTLLAAVLLWWALSGPQLRQQAVYPRPDGKYRVVVYRIPQRVAMPGQGSDAAGVVKLIDSKGRVIQETRVGLVREVQAPEWQEKSVRIPMIAEWPLPD